MGTRLKEAAKLGFARAYVPAAGDLDAKIPKLDVQRVSHLRELADAIGPCQ
jgi:predicted ATP-dependent serine protease